MLRPIVTAAMIAGAAPALAGIQPADGMWAGTWEMGKNEGCPQIMIDQINATTAGERSYERRIEFPEPFDPATMQGGDMPLEWSEVEPDVWQARYAESQATGMGQMSVDITSRLYVLSPDAMEQEVTVNLDLPATAATMLGMADGSCRWTSRVEHTRIE